MEWHFAILAFVRLGATNKDRPQRLFYTPKRNKSIIISHFASFQHIPRQKEIIIILMQIYCQNLVASTRIDAVFLMV